MELRGVAAGDLAGALRETNAIAAGTRTRRSIYHASPQPGSRRAAANAEEWGRAAEILERRLHLTGQRGPW